MTETPACSDCYLEPGAHPLETPDGMRFYVCKKCFETRKALDAEHHRCVVGRAMAHVPDQYTDAGLKDFTPNVRGALAAFLKAESPGLLTLTGPTGVGKTHAAFAIFLTVLHEGRQPCIFRRATALLLRWQALATESMGKLEAELERLCQHPQPVIVDDLGSEKMTDFGRSALYSLISEREAWKRPTVITTNLSVYEIGQRFDPRLADRLSGGLVVKLSGKSRRGT